MLMKMRIAIVIALLSLSLFASAEEVSDTNKIVASVGKKKFLYKDIKVEQKNIELLYRKKMSEEQLDQAILEEETRRLMAGIRLYIIESKVNELGITVSEKEIDDRVEENFKMNEIDSQKAERMIKISQSLHKSLVEWQKKPENEEAIYNKYLADSPISKEDWELHWRYYYNTPEKIKKMVVPNSLEDMKKQTRDSARDSLLYEKLKEHITKDVIVTEEEIKRKIEKQKGKDFVITQGVRELFKNHILNIKKSEARDKWRNNVYKDMNVVIDERYSKIREYFGDKRPEKNSNGKTEKKEKLPSQDRYKKTKITPPTTM